MKAPKTSFTAALKDVEPPKDYLTEENRMAWYSQVVDKILFPVVGATVDAVKKIGKKTKDDLEDVRDEFVDSVESTIDELGDQITGELVLENITFHYINEMASENPERFQYFCNKIAAMRDNVLKIERYCAASAALIMSRKVVTELSADQVEEIELAIKRMIQEHIDENSNNRG